MSQRRPGDLIMKRFNRLLAGVFLAAIVFSLREADAQALATALSKPEIQRDAKGLVTITCTTLDGVIRYSIDGSDPGPKGGPYLAPIALPQGGVVKARVFTSDRKEKGELASVELASLPGAARPASAFVPVTQDRDWPIYDWAKRHAAVTQLVNERKPTLVFIGDSITQMFGGEPHDRPQPGKEVWEKYYGKRNAANLGFGYDYTENVLWRIEHGELDGASAKVVVVLIGTNNTGKNSAGDIAGAIRAICDLVRKKQPQTKILLLGILPRSAKPDASRAKIAEINQLISRYDGHNGVTFLDVGGKFISADGTISKELMYDFLHPTAKGYEVLAAAMEPTLAKLLGEAGR